jgi:hypothetical protein
LQHLPETGIVVTEFLLPFLYSGLILLMVAKSGFFNAESITPRTFTFLTCIKIIAGLSYWLLHDFYMDAQDTDRFINEGNVVFSAIYENPLYYLQLVFGRNDYLPEPEHLCHYIDQMGFWYDQGNYSMVRINALIRLISFGSHPVHFIVFSFLSFIGCYHLFKFFERETIVHEYLLILVIFLMPGILFWTSGAHKEAIVIFLTGVIFNKISEIIHNNDSIGKWILVLAFIAILGFIRFYTMTVMLPGLIAFYVSGKTRVNPLLIFSGLYGLFIISAVIFDINSDGFRFAEEITIRQNSFIRSHGDTSFPLQEVSNSWTNIIKLIPQALFNPLVRPLPGTCHNLLCQLACAESIIYIVIFLFLLVRIKGQELLYNRTVLLCISVGLCLTLLIGLIVNNSGAIVRYRSISMLFMLMGLIISIIPVYRKPKIS